MARVYSLSVARTLAHAYELVLIYNQFKCSCALSKLLILFSKSAAVGFSYNTSHTCHKFIVLSNRLAGQVYGLIISLSIHDSWCVVPVLGVVCCWLSFHIDHAASVTTVSWSSNTRNAEVCGLFSGLAKSRKQLTCLYWTIAYWRLATHRSTLA